MGNSTSITQETRTDARETRYDDICKSYLKINLYKEALDTTHTVVDFCIHTNRVDLIRKYLKLISDKEEELYHSIIQKEHHNIEEFSASLKLIDDEFNEIYNECCAETGIGLYRE